MPRFELDCTACSFDRVVQGTIEDVYDRVEEHQAERESDPAEHNVDFERLDVDFERLEDPSEAGTTPD